MSARVMSGRRRIESASRRRDTLAAIERLSGLLEGGISASDALSAAAECQGPGARLLHGVSLRVSKGMSLSRALEHSGGHLDATDIALVRAGEHSGDLPRSLELLTRRLSRKLGARRGLLRLLAYPSIVISSALLVVAGTSTFILPTFAALYSNGSVQLPTLTRVVLAAGPGAVEAAAGTCATAFALAAVLSVVRTGSPSLARSLDRLRLRLPITGRLDLLVQREALYETLALLTSAGIAVDQALALARDSVSNRAIAAGVGAVRARVQGGMRLSEAIGRDRSVRCIFADPLDGAMLRAAEFTGNYPRAFSRLAADAAGEHSHRAALLSSIVEPLTTLFVALLVGTTVLALYQPILGASSLLLGHDL